MKITLSPEDQSRLYHEGSLHILNLGEHEVGENFQVETPCRVRKLCEGQVKIGAFSYVKSGWFDKNTKVEIGRYCSIAEDVVFNLGEHPLDWLSTSDFQWSSNFIDAGNSAHLKHDGNAKTTIIGNDVWIGHGVRIKSGVVIGNGAIIGTGALVTKNVPAYGIVMASSKGVEGTVKKYRHSPEIIKKLLDLKWWDFAADQLDNVSFNNIELAIEQIQKLIDYGALTMPYGFVPATDIVNHFCQTPTKEVATDGKSKKKKRFWNFR